MMQENTRKAENCQHSRSIIVSVHSQHVQIFYCKPSGTKVIKLTACLVH